jgi:hypothetical protein
VSFGLAVRLEGRQMGLLDQIRAARQAHKELRSTLPSRATLTRKADCYRAVKAGLDQLWEAADQPGGSYSAEDVRRAIRQLTTDAEYYAGLSDAEGFRDPAEVWGEYDLLERAFDGCG